MYDKVGEKLKAIASFICGFGIVIAVIVGVMEMATVSKYSGGIGFLIGMIIISVGSLLSWLSGIFIYAFGELVDNSEANLRVLSSIRQDIASINSSEILNKACDDEQTKQESVESEVIETNVSEGAVNTVNRKPAKEVLETLMSMDTAKEMREYVQGLNDDRYIDILKVLENRNEIERMYGVNHETTIRIVRKAFENSHLSCKRCGKELKTNEIFCSACGFKNQ